MRKLTTFYLAKNDHRWVTFISVKRTACRPRSSRSCASPHKRQRQPPQRALNRVLLNGRWKAAGPDLPGRGEKTATSIQKRQQQQQNSSLRNSRKTTDAGPASAEATAPPRASSSRARRRRGRAARTRPSRRRRRRTSDSPPSGLLLRPVDPMNALCNIECSMRKLLCFQSLWIDNGQKIFAPKSESMQPIC